MKEEKKITQSDIDQAEVKLHPIAGVSPRAYVPAAFAALALLALFLVFMLPGITKFGSYLVFQGAPGKSAVYRNDSYIGSTGQRIYLPAGKYSLRIEHQGFLPQTVDIRVGGRLIGSLLFPRRQNVKFSLAAEEPGAYLAKAYAEYLAWSVSGKPSALYQIPPVLSDAAAALAGAGALKSAGAASAAGAGTAPQPAAGAVSSGSAVPAGAAIPAALSFAQDVLSATDSAESARDGMKAGVLVATAGLPGPLSMASAARVAVAALGSRKAGAAWLKDLLPKSKSSSGASSSDAGKSAANDAILKAAASAADIAASAGAPASAAPGNAASDKPRPRGSASVGGVDFALFSAGSVAMGGEAPSGTKAGYLAAVPAFGLARTEVTVRQWEAFLAANPRWQPSNLAALKAAGLADDDYLSGWDANRASPGSADKPVTGVSWAAASAYCEWLNAKAGGAWKVVLPSEAMWEAAARAGLSNPAATGEKKATWSDTAKGGPARAGAAGMSAAGLADMFGNVWEWTSDSYVPYPAFYDGALAGDEKAVRGGSWANAPDSISLFSRGGIPSAHSSAFLGFRPALAQK